MGSMLLIGFAISQTQCYTGGLTVEAIMQIIRIVRRALGGLLNSPSRPAVRIHRTPGYEEARACLIGSNF